MTKVEILGVTLVVITLIAMIVFAGFFLYSVYYVLHHTLNAPYWMSLVITLGLSGLPTAIVKVASEGILD